VLVPARHTSRRSSDRASSSHWRVVQRPTCDGRRTQSFYKRRIKTAQRLRGGQTTPSAGRGRQARGLPPLGLWRVPVGGSLAHEAARLPRVVVVDGAGSGHRAGRRTWPLRPCAAVVPRSEWSPRSRTASPAAAAASSASSASQLRLHVKPFDHTAVGSDALHVAEGAKVLLPLRLSKVSSRSRRRRGGHLARCSVDVGSNSTMTVSLVAFGLRRNDPSCGAMRYLSAVGAAPPEPRRTDLCCMRACWRHTLASPHRAREGNSALRGLIRRLGRRREATD